MKKLASFIAGFLFITNFSIAQDAVYKVEFISNWSSTTHPTDYPSGSAHWSPLIGTTHKDAGQLLQIGGQATDGVEQVAESGGTSIITQEINALIAAELANQIINGSGLSNGLGTITINDVNVDADFPFISLLTMIAPSPDWIAMIANQKLTDASNNWQQSISVDVYAVDAGTDSSATYNSNNADTNPRENISSLQDTAPFSDKIIGTFVFTLQSVLSINNPELEKSIAVYPNPSNGTVFIKNLGNTILKNVEIYAVNGKRLQFYNNTNTKNNIELNSLASGMYFLKLNSDKGSITKKLVVQ